MKSVKLAVALTTIAVLGVAGCGDDEPAQDCVTCVSMEAAEVCRTEVQTCIDGGIDVNMCIQDVIRNCEQS